ncbi:hypothetical protein RhiLY_09815 [Ceratobasidium sp. AG-Ba]|nr:hypothetical protein RhiLY_09815 [Ceratobasidium sp. AG-Ba]
MYFSELAKYLVFTILACLDNSTYVGMAAIDAGARAIHASIYVGLSRAGLQLPVGAFVPPPPPLSTGSLVLYVTPAAVASWPSMVNAWYNVPKTLDDGFQIMRHVAANLAAHHQRLAPSLMVIMPPFLTASQLAYVSVCWSRNAKSSLALPSPPHGHLTFPTFNVSSLYLRHDHCPIPIISYSSTLLEDIFLGLSPADHRAPYSATIGLRQCTPRRVLPIQQEVNTPEMELGDTGCLVVCETPVPTAEKLMEVVTHESPSSSDQDYQTTDTVITIHLRTCLIGLFVLCCALVAVLRQILRLVSWIFSNFPVMNYCPGDLLLVWVLLKFVVGICVRFLARRKATRVPPIDSSADTHTDAPPPSLSHLPPAIEANSTHVPFVDSGPLPTPTPQLASSEPTKKKKKNKKNKKNKKKKAGSGAAMAVDPAEVPLPADDERGWAASPTMVPLPLSPPLSPLPGTAVPPLSLPPPLSGAHLLLEHDEEQPIPSPAAPTAPHAVTPPLNLLLVGASSVSLVETPQADNEQSAEPRKNLPAPVQVPFASSSEQTGAAFSAVDESGQDDGGDWTVVERKRKPRRTPEPILGAASASDSKVKKGSKAGKRLGRGSKA